MTQKWGESQQMRFNRALPSATFAVVDQQPKSSYGESFRYTSRPKTQVYSNSQMIGEVNTGLRYHEMKESLLSNQSMISQRNTTAVTYGTHKNKNI